MTRSVLIYANCQGEELMLNGRYVPSLAGEFTFKWIPAHKVAAGDCVAEALEPRPVCLNHVLTAGSCPALATAGLILVRCHSYLGSRME